VIQAKQKLLRRCVVVLMVATPPTRHVSHQSAYPSLFADCHFGCHPMAVPVRVSATASSIINTGHTWARARSIHSILWTDQWEPSVQHGHPKLSQASPPSGHAPYYNITMHVAVHAAGMSPDEDPRGDEAPLMLALGEPTSCWDCRGDDWGELATRDRLLPGDSNVSCEGEPRATFMPALSPARHA
jgi:hypothetical protein